MNVKIFREMLDSNADCGVVIWENKSKNDTVVEYDISEFINEEYIEYDTWKVLRVIPYFEKEKEYEKLSEHLNEIIQSLKFVVVVSENLENDEEVPTIREALDIFGPSGYTGLDVEIYHGSDMPVREDIEKVKAEYMNTKVGSITLKLRRMNLKILVEKYPDCPLTQMSPVVGFEVESVEYVNPFQIDEKEKEEGRKILETLVEAVEKRKNQSSDHKVAKS